LILASLERSQNNYLKSLQILEE